MSAFKLSRMLGVTQNGWFMCHRIRKAWHPRGRTIGGENKVVEADETFVGRKTVRLPRRAEEAS